MTLPTSFQVSLPDWALAELAGLAATFFSLEERMRLVIDWSRRNFETDTGGPFAAGVFEEAGGRLIALGVNRVVPESCAQAHAEIVALSLAQQKLRSFDLGAKGFASHQLVVNWRPCAMCFGALPWSGIRSLVIAGSGPELEALTGFDEGPIHPDWPKELERRGIRVTEGLLKDEAVGVFRDFAASGKQPYNGRGNARP